MSSPFIPLLSVNPNVFSVPAPNRAEGQTPAGNSFVPVLDTPVVPIAAAPKAPSPDAPPVACSNPLVTLQKDGDSVTHVRIQCSCGQVIELACAY